MARPVQWLAPPPRARGPPVRVAAPSRGFAAGHGHHLPHRGLGRARLARLAGLVAQQAVDARFGGKAPLAAPPPPPTGAGPPPPPAGAGPAAPLPRPRAGRPNAG